MLEALKRPAPLVDGFDALQGQGINARNITACPNLPGNLSTAIVTTAEENCRLQGIPVWVSFLMSGIMHDCMVMYSVCMRTSIHVVMGQEA